MGALSKAMSTVQTPGDVVFFASKVDAGIKSWIIDLGGNEKKFALNQE